MSTSALTLRLIVVLCILFKSETRLLPMIVWDHFSPLLSCKCNWLTFSKIDVYDKLDFVCPSLKMAMKSFDFAFPTEEQMNENIFRRKWEGNNLDDLKNSLNDGSFCDPQNNETVKIFSCTSGTQGHSLLVKFKSNNKPSKNYEKGDIVVFFNNGNGKKETLNSKRKRCSSVFIVNVTQNAEVHHDFSYGKCLNDIATSCHDINTKCGRTCRAIQEFSPPVKQTTVSPTVLKTKITKKPTKHITETFAKVLTPEHYHRNTSCNEFNVKYFGIGLIAGVGLCCVIFVIFFFIMRVKGHHEQRQNSNLVNKKMVLRLS